MRTCFFVVVCLLVFGFSATSSYSPQLSEVSIPLSCSTENKDVMQHGVTKERFSATYVGLSQKLQYFSTVLFSQLQRIDYHEVKKQN